MTKFLLRLSLCTAALAAVTTTVANAADYEPPPPPEEMRGTWTGPYVGGFVGGTFIEGHYVTSFDPEMSGTGGYAGVLGGFLYDFGGLVVGVEGDYGWGFSTTAQNRTPAEDTEFSIDTLATIRARLGWAFDDTLIYGTAGYGWMETTFGGLVGNPAIPDEDEGTHEGWVVGGGMEYRFIDGLSGRLEYLYGDFGDEDYSLVGGGGLGGDLTLSLDNVHIVRAALVYNFGNLW